MIEELELLANKQRELECDRIALREAVKEAFASLSPLRAQMQEVITRMKSFYEKEASYIELSQQTSKDLVANIRAVGLEIEQTQELLDDGRRLSESAIEIPEAMVKPLQATDYREQVTEKAPEGGIEQEIDRMLNTFGEQGAQTNVRPPLELSPAEQLDAEQRETMEKLEKIQKEAAGKESVSNSDRFWTALEDLALYTPELIGTDALVELQIPAEIAKEHEALSREAMGGKAALLITYDNYDRLYPEKAFVSYNLQVEVCKDLMAPVAIDQVFSKEELRRLKELGFKSLQRKEAVMEAYENEEMEESVHTDDTMDELEDLGGCSR